MDKQINPAVLDFRAELLNPAEVPLQALIALLPTAGVNFTMTGQYWLTRNKNVRRRGGRVSWKCGEHPESDPAAQRKNKKTENITGTNP